VIAPGPLPRGKPSRFFSGPKGLAGIAHLVDRQRSRGIVIRGDAAWKP